MFIHNKINNSTNDHIIIQRENILLKLSIKINCT